MTSRTVTSRIALPPVKVGGLDLSVRRDLQEPGGGPPYGYPYKDEPMPDAARRESLVSITLTTLHTHFDHRSDVLVSGDVFIYYRDESDTRRSLAPDVLALFGPDMAQYRDRYGLSLAEIGQPPNFIMEIASPSTSRADLGYKRDAYHWIGVDEYWLFDPDGGELYGQPLAWEQRIDGEYRQMPLEQDADGILWAYSPALGLSIAADGDRLRFHDPSTGQYLRTHAESEAALAESEAALSDERTMREAAEAQVLELQAQLQRLQAERGQQG